MPPSPLEVSKMTLVEACRRLDKNKVDLAEAEARYRDLYQKWQRGKINSRQVDAAHQRVKNLEYAIQSMLPKAIADAYRRYIWEYYTEKSLIEYPYDISSMVASRLGDGARRIRRQIEETYMEKHARRRDQAPHPRY